MIPFYTCCVLEVEAQHCGGPAGSRFVFAAHGAKLRHLVVKLHEIAYLNTI